MTDTPLDLEGIAYLINIARGKDDLLVWTVYQRPSDFSEEFVARPFSVKTCDSTAGGPVSLGVHFKAPHLEMVRDAFLRMGLTCLPRDPSDDANIVESWI